VRHQGTEESRIEAIARVVAEYERSGLTRRGFSERTGIAVSTLDYWRREVRQGKQARIVPVKVESRGPEAAACAPVGFRLDGYVLDSGDPNM
jgi:transposase-like protein